MVRRIIVLTMFLPGLAGAQTGVVRPVTNPDVEISAAPLADQKLALANLNRVLEAMKHATPLSAPNGFDVDFRRSLHLSRTGRMNGGLTGIIFFYSKDPDSGKLVPDEEGPGWSLQVNQPFGCVFADWHEPFMEDDSGSVYFEPRPDGTEHGYPHYYHGPAGGCTLISSISKPLWVPVSKERVLRQQLAHQREAVQNVRDLVTRLKGLAQIPPDVMTQLNDQEAKLAQAEKAFANMTPAQRAEQADFNGAKLVAVNPDYFDKTVPRTKIQTISLWLDMPETYQWYNETKGRIFKQIRDELDWAALQAIVR